MNRGSAERIVNDQLGVETSMRPRFMNRGSKAAKELQQGNIATSMRPRFMNRGSAVDLTAMCPAVVHFNEAPIHESGKSGTSSSGRP